MISAQGFLLVGGFGLRATLVTAEVLLATPAVLALLLAGRRLPEALALSAPGGRTLGLSIALGGAFWGLSLGLFEVQYALWQPPPGYLDAFQRLHDLLKPAGPLDALVSLTAIAFAPAFCEELVFRGTVFPALARGFGATVAVLGSAILFGIIHVDAAAGSVTLYRVPFAVAVGLCLALLRARTGSLAPPILAHATLNAITFFAAPLASSVPGTLPDPQPVLGGALFVAGGALSAWLFRKLPLTRPEAPA